MRRFEALRGAQTRDHACARGQLRACTALWRQARDPWARRGWPWPVACRAGW